jgi:hypothetical protein
MAVRWWYEDSVVVMGGDGWRWNGGLVNWV